jgi:hypothetical protein
VKIHLPANRRNYCFVSCRESASKILSQQLNNLAGDLISGVELNFDLVSSQDYTTGQLENKTDLNVGISKKLLNDRLKVTGKQLWPGRTTKKSGSQHHRR